MYSVPLTHVFEQVHGPAPDDLVTVAVSLFNYERFLAGCLESVAAQHHKNIDLIIVDDASDLDESCSLAERWLKENCRRFSRSLLLRHQSNQGLAQTRNTAFSFARSDPVFVLDADNELYPRAIGRLLVPLKAGYSAAYSQLEFFQDESRLGYASVWNRETFKKGNYVDAMAMISKACWQRVGGYTHTEIWEDYDLWCKFIEAGMEACFVPEVLCRYRVHRNSMLRTDSAAVLRRVTVEMMFRHPWLEL